MGIYIKGMDAPKNCAKCEWLLQRFPGGKYWCKRTNTMVHETWASANLNPIPQNCPLVPVLPHGRLIDADAFSEKIIEIVERQKYDVLYAKNLSVGEILREVVNELRGTGLDGFVNAPTIIPAESLKEEE